MIVNFTSSTWDFLFVERLWMRLFQPNRYFNASYERPILELSVEKCYPIVSGLDRPSKLRLFVNSDLPSNNSTQNQPKPTKDSCKPANFRQSLQFTCGLHSWHLLSFVFWEYGWVEIATLRLVIYSGCRSLIKLVSARSNRLLGMPQNLCRKVINGYILFS